MECVVIKAKMQRLSFLSQYGKEKPCHVVKVNVTRSNLQFLLKRYGAE